MHHEPSAIESEAVKAVMEDRSIYTINRSPLPYPNTRLDRQQELK